MAIKHTSRSKIHPQKFGLWMALASITMMFGAFTSAYIVKQSAGNWLEFGLPQIFFVSSAVIVLSSITLHVSYLNFKKENYGVYKGLMLVTLALGLSFVVLQYFGWMTLFSMGVDLKGNPSGSFLYLITGVHAAHVVGGICAILVATMHALTLKNKVTKKRIHRFQLTYNYWHFMGFLWIYLLGFLLLSK